MLNRAKALALRIWRSGIIDTLAYVMTIQGIVVVALAAVVGYFAGKGQGFMVFAAILEVLLLIAAITRPLWGLVAWVVLAPIANTYLEADSFLRIMANAVHLWWILIMFISVILHRFVQKKRLKPIGLTEAGMFGFTLYAVISMVATSHMQVLGESLGLTMGLYPNYRMFYVHYTLGFFAYFLGRHLITNEKAAKAFTIACMVVMCPLVYVGIYEHRTGLSFWTGQLYYRDIGVGRVAGPFASPVIFGVVFGAAWLFSIHGFLQLKGRFRYFLVPFLFLAMPVIYWTYTRSVWVSIPVSGLMLFLLYPGLRRTIVIWCIIFFSFLAIYWPVYTSGNAYKQRLMASYSVLERKLIARMGVRMFAKSPIVGLGQGMYDLYNRKEADVVGIPIGSILVRRGSRVTTSHNTFLTLLVELGVVGFSLYMLIYVGLLIRILMLYRYVPGGQFFGRELLGTAGGAIIVHVVNSMLIDMRFFSYSECLIMVCFGIIAAVLDTVDPKVRRQEEADRQAGGISDSLPDSDSPNEQLVAQEG